MTPSPANDDARYYRPLLRALIDLGADLARQLLARAKERPDTGAMELALAYEQINRAVRRAILLSVRLDEPAPVHASQEGAAARRRLIREVEDAMQRSGKAKGKRPAAEVIADICRDLGLAAASGPADWQRRAPADIAALCARAAGR